MRNRIEQSGTAWNNVELSGTDGKYVSWLSNTTYWNKNVKLNKVEQRGTDKKTYSTVGFFIPSIFKC